MTWGLLFSRGEIDLLEVRYLKHVQHTGELFNFVATAHHNGDETPISVLDVPGLAVFIREMEPRSVRAVAGDDYAALAIERAQGGLH
jgi:hypothetical protein